MDVLTVKQAAEYLQINPQTISRKLQHGVLPGRKVGKSYRIRKEDLDEYLKGEPSPEVQLRLYHEARRQADAEIPQAQLRDTPDVDAAISKAIAAIGYEGKEEQFWRDIGPLAPDDELIQRYRAAVAVLPDEDRALIRASDEISGLNQRLRRERAKEFRGRLDELLAAKGYELADDGDPYTGEELLVAIDTKAKKGSRVQLLPGVRAPELNK